MDFADYVFESVLSSEDSQSRNLLPPYVECVECVDDDPGRQWRRVLTLNQQQKQYQPQGDTAACCSMRMMMSGIYRGGSRRSRSMRMI